MIATRALFATALVTLAPAAWAGSLSLPTSEPGPAYAQPVVESAPNLVFTLRGGVATTPEYFGSDDYEFGPDFGFSLNQVDLGPLKFGSPDPYARSEGVALRGSFRYIDERTADDNPELQGLADVDATYEVGLGVGYRSERFDAYADVRYGINGHESIVGELGADLKAHPSDRLTLSAGPRVLLGSDDYASTYFDVPTTTTSFDAYDADGGLISAGVEVGAKYRFTENWGVEGAVTYDRFLGDAADSPIVENGDQDQYGMRVGLTRRITLDF
ncbi:MipA/OmpV family protein [Palleronia sp.]|uniref:MipA/OmpV family protein n=1 Tax=Palleronia sp. TaxID=1940284 RepID=UPI0035C7A0F2